MDWILGLTGSVLIAAAAYWKRALSGSGAFAAVGVGTCLYALGSVSWFGLMIGFFVSSTLLTKWKKHLKKDAEAKYQKSGRRDAGQVLANGGIGALLCILSAVYPGASWLVIAYVGVMATVTADTWATEIGGFSKRDPRSILTWKQVPKGTSGGVSWLGWAASAGGGAFIGILFCLFAKWDQLVESGLWPVGIHPIWVLPAALLTGWIGANADSLLGATVQAVYRCPCCGEEVEARQHCGHKTELLRGWRRMDNDAVNLISSVCGGGFIVLMGALLQLLG